MKKILCVILTIVCLIITGCGKKEYISVSFEDRQFHFLTTFSYDKKLDYTFKKAPEERNQYAYMTLTSEKNNIVVDFEYDELTKGQFEINQDSVSKYDNFQKYSFNGYEAYTFSTGEDNLYCFIILGNQEKEINAAIYLRFALLKDDVKTNIKEIFDQEDFQYFLNSIKFQKVEE